MMDFEEFKKIKKNMSEEELNGLNAFADLLINAMADKEPLAKLIKTNTENMEMQHQIISKIMDIKKDRKQRDEKSKKFTDILNQFTNVMKDFEKEEL